MGQKTAPFRVTRGSVDLALPLVILCLIGILVADVVLWPEHNLSILYAVPILAVALRRSPRFVLAVAALVVVLDLVSIPLKHPPSTIWPFTLFALAIIGYLAVLVALGKQETTLASHHKHLEDRLALVTENARDFIYRYRLVPTRSFDYVSPAVTALTGYTPEEFYVDPDLPWKIVHPDDRPHLDILNQMPAPMEGYTHTLRWRRKDGAEIWTEEQIAPIIDAGGNLTAIVGIARDVTARKQAESVLRQSEERFRLLVDGVKDYALILLDGEGRVSSWNTGAERITGYRADEIIGQHVARFYLPDDITQGKPDDELGRALAEGRFEDEGWRVRKDHSRFWANVVVTALQDETGALRGYAKVIRDITESNQAKRELTAQYAVARALAEAPSLHEAIPTILRVVGTSLGWPRGAFWQEEPAAGVLRCVDIWHDQSLVSDALAERNRQVVCTPDAGLVGQAWTSGKLSWVPNLADEENSLRALPITQEGLQAAFAIPIRVNNEVVGVTEFLTSEIPRSDAGLLAMLDTIGSQISAFAERVHAENQLKQTADALAQQTVELVRSNAELQQFAYVASHDLQEPLRMVASYTQLLARRYHGKLDADADEFIGFAVDGAIRMQDLINDLLAYSRVSTQGDTFAPTDCNIVVDRVIADLNIAITEAQAVVTRDNLPQVLADAAQLGQLFQNLIGNALKYYGAAPPRVHISAQHQEKTWVFAVTDQGIGIDPRYFNRIFVIFQRLHTRSEYPGTGMGLAICKKIVERHGGQIWVDSQPGHGTTFSFTIPER